MREIADLMAGGGRAMELYEIADGAGVSMDEAKAGLDELIRAGRVVLTRKGRYASAASQGLVPARTLVLRSGALAARPLDGGTDMLIDEDASPRPMLDDTILVRPEPHYGGGMGRCALRSITRRAHETFMAVLSSQGDRLQAASVDPRLAPEIRLEGELLGASDGDMALLRVTRWPESGKPLRAAIERVMGRADDIRVQLRAIAINHELADEFPPDVIAQAANVPTAVSEADLEGRADLRHLTLFTIDGDDAQDFDDAVSLELLGGDGGAIKLGVHIADVSHYVRPGAPIDREALSRGTSVYLPGLTLPMLPEALSNRMCSLMEGADRLAMSLIMTVRDGKLVDHELSPSVIHSRARLTYAQVNLMLDGQPSDVPEGLHQALKDMAALAHTLREKRHARGSIDFDMPEPHFTLDANGFPQDVRARDRGEAERLIEDFMLLANETVAALARATELPLLYRVHGEPDSDRVRALELFLSGLGIRARLGANPAPGKYQKILEDAEGKPEYAMIQQVMLRSLRRAQYSEAPEGHFGLAARDYCHFTSPIRRYPDLVVHRMLKLQLAGDSASFPKHERRMPELAKLCSDAERRATLAERDADDLLKAHYMASRVGETFDGVVTGVTAWGFYVTLENTVEGMVPLRTLRDEYQFDPERHQLRTAQGRAIRLGDPARVRVERVDTALAQIDFTLAEG